MKNIAVYIYGHSRTFKKTVNNFKKHIVESNRCNDINIDVYIATWLEEDVGGERLDKKEQAYMKEKYRPKDIMFIDLTGGEYVEYKNKTLSYVPLITVNVSYALKMCHQMCKRYIERESIEYDAVLITRPDILFKYDLNLNPFVHKKSRGFTVSDDKLRLFFSYVLSDFYGQPMDISRYICGIDLLSIQSFDVVDNFSKWDLTEDIYHTLLPEFSLTKYYSNIGCKIGILGYEKDRAFEICRNRGLISKLIFSEPVQILFTGVFYPFFIFFLLSQKFRDKIFFNKHLLSLMKMRKLLTFLK